MFSVVYMMKKVYYQMSWKSQKPCLSRKTLLWANDFKSKGYKTFYGDYELPTYITYLPKCYHEPMQMLRFPTETKSIEWKSGLVYAHNNVIYERDEHFLYTLDSF